MRWLTTPSSTTILLGLILLALSTCLAKSDVAKETKSGGGEQTDESCDSSSKSTPRGDAGPSNKYAFQSRLAATLKAQDDERIRFLLDPFEEYNGVAFASDNAVRDAFYRVVGMPLQTPCNVAKKLGGKWLYRCGFVDGDKHVCMDALKEGEECLVYSFGVADDWSFEDAMGAMGCKVRAFDPSIAAPAKRSDNVSFHKLGIAHFSGNTQIKTNGHKGDYMTVPVKTLGDILEEFGDGDKEVFYLKVDVEGSELEALPEWIESGSLRNVRQLGLEFHTGRSIVPDEEATETFAVLIQSIQKLHEMGFRLISYQPNGCVGKNGDLFKKYYSYFDVVFYRAGDLNLAP